MSVEITLLVTLLICFLEELAGHGLMQSPPARNYMWRLGFDTERNYNDMGLNCGGFSNQWDTNGGRCGTCGDPYQGPRDHEAGGYFAKVDRPISQCYSSNSKIDVKIRITAYHKGYFEFRLCQQNDLTTPVTQYCLDQTVLTISGTNQTRFDINSFQTEFYIFQLDIPKDITCEQCVIQWLYNTGNSYGCDINNCGVGFGPQEQFVNCADIAILPDCSQFKIQTTNTSPTNQDNSHSQVTHDWSHSHDADGDWNNWNSEHDSDEEWAHSYDDDDDDDNTQTTTGWLTTKTSSRAHPYGCYARRPFVDVPGMDDWCQQSCFANPPFCPQTHCRCGGEDLETYQEVKRCIGVGFWAQLAGFSDWCNINCNHNPSFCPSGMCQCY